MPTVWLRGAFQGRLTIDPELGTDANIVATKAVHPWGGWKVARLRDRLYHWLHCPARKLVSIKRSVVQAGINVIYRPAEGHWQRLGAYSAA